MTAQPATTARPSAPEDPECCGTPMVHNSFTGQYECADAYFTLVDDGVFHDGESSLRVDLANLTPYLRERYDHWQASCRPDDDHGPFSLHPDSCAGCIAECDAVEQRFRAGMAERGIVLRGYKDMTPEEQRQVDDEDERAMLAGEHLAAAGYPDPCERMYDENGNDL